MGNSQAFLDSIYAGGPKILTDAQGEWQSSIFRDRVEGPVQVERRGLVGDQATQPYHGSSECAVCCHLLDHYRFWNVQYGMSLEAGNVGENFALEQITEDEVCIGDMYRVGITLVQVSAPRIPCANQARRIGRADWARLTIRELRPGFYLRVLEPGVVQAGDGFALAERLNPGATLVAFNRCWYHHFDPALAEQLSKMPGLMAWWQGRFAEKLAKRER